MHWKSCCWILIGALLAGCGADVRRVVDPSTGQVLEEAEWDGAQLHGEHRTWYSDGTPRSQGTWDHGVPVGLHLRWHPTGQLEVRGAFVDGLRDGPWPTWYEDGHAEWEGVWVAGERDSTWTRYDPTGAVLELEEWDRGTRVSHVDHTSDGLR